MAGFVVALCGALTGRSALAADDGGAQAFKPGLVYAGAAFANLGGGLRPGATYSSNLNLQLTVDGDAWLGWSDTLGYVDALSLQGGLPSSFIGDAQGISSISAPNAVSVYEAWIQKNLLDNHLSILVGLYDLSSEFYRLQSASLFLNSSFGIGPEFSQSGVEGPSVFPDTSVGMRVAVKPVENVVIRAAVLDGVPLDRPDGSHGVFEPGDGALIVGEVAFLGRPSLGTHPASGPFQIGRKVMLGDYEEKFAIGAWHYTGTFNDLSVTQADGQPVQHHGSSGIYLVTDHVLYQDPERAARKLSGFVQAGLGDYRVDRFGSYVGAGLVATGPFAGRDADQLGLSVAHARNGSHYVSSQDMQGLPVTAAETAIELTYLAQVNAWLALQPDLQYIVTPNTTNAIPNAWAFQLRIEMTF